MPKTGAELTRVYQTRRRQEARLAGRCTRCCVRLPSPGKRTCDLCNMAAKARVKSMRERQRVQRRRSDSARLYAAQGDAAASRFAYVEAILRYERALARTNSKDEKCFLLEKMGLAYLNGARPERAIPCFEQALELSLTAEMHWNSPYLLRDIARNRWIDARTPEALPLLEEARRLSTNLSHDQCQSFCRRLDTLTANCLTLLGRYAEAATYFFPGKYRKPTSNTTISLAAYTNQEAIYHATCGRAPEAYARFEFALKEAKRFVDGSYVITILDDYATWAMELGRLDIARGCWEQALFIARERRVGWRIPYFTLRVATAAVKGGEYEHAQSLLADALTYDTETPILRILRSTLALEISYILNDSDLMRRAVDDEALELAFQSAEPQRIGRIVAAYVRKLVASGNRRRAKMLIARALAVLSQADHSADLFALAAQYGSHEHAEAARQCLIERTQLPHHRVAHAYLYVWEAHMAIRRRAIGLAIGHVEKAARVFARLGWKHEQNQTLGLIGKTSKHDQPALTLENPPLVFGMLNPALTNREREVAEYALKGLTNRAIAEMLGISEHTVESHVSSILSRLGLRSRWQLIQLSEK